MSDAPFLDSEPPHWAARGLAWLLIAVVAVAVVGSVVVRVPETVDSRFVLVPLRGADPVRAAQDGVIEQVRVVEGQAVKAGDILYLLRSSPGGDRSSERQSLAAQMSGTQQSLSNAQAQQRSSEQADERQAARYEARRAEIARIVELKGQQQAMSAELAEKYARLEGKGYVTHEAVLKQRSEASRLAVEVEQARAEGEEVRAAAERLRIEAQRRALAYHESVRQLREEHDKASIRAGILDKDPLVQVGGAMGVAAACDGTVIRQKVRASGAVVLDGDVLAELACAADTLQAELSVPPTGVGRLQVGQGVKLLYDAFPYQRYGVRYATLRWISPASVPVNDAPVFRAVAAIADRAIALPDGPRPLLSGMGGVAKIVVGSRSLASYVLAPVRGLVEDLAQPPQGPPAPQRSVKSEPGDSLAQVKG